MNKETRYILIEIKNKLTIQPSEALNTFINSYFESPKDNLLIFDIETTGLSARNCCCYLIGCIYFSENIWYYRQWLAECFDDEHKILEHFCDFAKTFDTLIHFNGDSFDIPFIRKRLTFYNSKNVFEFKNNIDVFRLTKTCANILKLDNYTQKNIEQFMNIERTDRLCGKELIEVYKHFIAFKEEENLNLLLLHNYEDVYGLLNILPILSYTCIAKSVDRLKCVHYPNESGNITFEFESDYTFPVNLNIFKEADSFSKINVNLTEKTLHVNISVLSKQLKYFFSNYKDYYYLVQEDQAIHKSVATYVDKAYRVPAKASTCYIKKQGNFIIKPHNYDAKAFKHDYTDKFSYMELTDELINSEENCINYIKALLT